MSRNLGHDIPIAVAEFLSVSEQSRDNAVIMLITGDSENYPHVALLSPFQVVSSGNSDINFCVYQSTETQRNILSGGKVTFVVQRPPGIFYIKCRVDLDNTAVRNVGGAPQMFFRASVVKVLEDSSPQAPITSETGFRLENVADRYGETFRALVDFTMHE